MSTEDTVFHCMSATHCREQHEQSYQASACFIYTAFAPIGSIITAATRVCQWSVVKAPQKGAVHGQSGSEIYGNGWIAVWNNVTWVGLPMHS